jgi:iron(III) transport system substrate-binding protein
MDLQFKLASDGLSMQYQSPEVAKLPDGTVWQNQAFGTTLEPFALVYNKKALGDPPPQNHADLAKLFKDKADLLKNKVTAYDPEKSGTGYLAMNEDARHYPTFWELAKAFGKVDLKVYTSTGSMIEKVRSGEHSLGYDIIGSYVLPVMKKDQTVGLALPKDFTVAFSRIAFVAKKAPRPNAGKLFLDYVLSKQGQETMSTQSLLYAIRSDVQGDVTAAGLKKELGDSLKPIAVSESLLDNLDQAKRQEFFGRWKQAMGR